MMGKYVLLFSSLENIKIYFHPYFYYDCCMVKLKVLKKLDVLKT